jgi:hypothetical protein
VASWSVTSETTFLPDVGRQMLGVEHWVGGTWEFAHSWVSKTHTCIRGVANAS